MFRKFSSALPLVVLTAGWLCMAVPHPLGAAPQETVDEMDEPDNEELKMKACGPDGVKFKATTDKSSHRPPKLPLTRL